MGLFLILLCLEGVMGTGYRGKGFISRGEYHFIGEDNGLNQELAKRMTAPEYRTRSIGPTLVELAVPQIPPSIDTPPFLLKELTPFQPQAAFDQLEYMSQDQYDMLDTQVRRSYAQSGKAKPQPRRPAPQSGKAKPQPGAAIPKYGKAKPQSGGATPKSSKAIPQRGEATPKSGKAKPQPGGATPKSGKAKPQPGRANPEPLKSRRQGPYSAGDTTDKQLGDLQMKTMQSAIYIVQTKLRQVDWILQKYAVDPRYRMAYIFMKLEEWQRDCHIYKDYSSYSDYWIHRQQPPNYNVYWHIVYFGLCLRKDIDVTYTIDYLLYLHKKQQELAVQFMADMKSQVPGLGR